MFGQAEEEEMEDGGRSERTTAACAGQWKNNGMEEGGRREKSMETETTITQKRKRPFVEQEKEMGPSRIPSRTH
jgi:hypothetical protein